MEEEKSVFDKILDALNKPSYCYMWLKWLFLYKVVVTS